MRRYLGLTILVIVAVAAVAWWGSREPAGPEIAPGEMPEMVAVTRPGLSGDTLIGARAFGVKCAACHGPNAGGIDGSGPPLVHQLYVPGHHGDMAFVLAARRGVQSHHWRFGDMPPVEGITDAEIAVIIAYVRALQQENGIF